MPFAERSPFILTSIFRVVKFNGTKPLEGRLPSPLLADMDFLYEAQAGQHICNVIQSTHLSCKEGNIVQLGQNTSKSVCHKTLVALSYPLLYLLWLSES